MARRIIHAYRHDADLRPFAEVSQNLEGLGCTSVERFLTSPTDDPDEYYVALARDIASAPSPPPMPLEPPELKSDTKPIPATNTGTRMQKVARIHQTCQRVFGSTDALKYEFLEENGASSKQCILTITRPNGLTRSYATQPVFSRKNEAKAQAASLALELGVIDFIVKGEPDASKHKKGLILAPLDGPDGINDAEAVTAPPVEDDPAVKEIEACCAEWRAERVKPHWVALHEPKVGNNYGCALRITLSPHSSRVYSSTVSFETLVEAKKACAIVAMEQDVLEYIKHGNGQTQPAQPDTLQPGAPVASTSEITPDSTPPSAMTLQGFYDSLPQPFPEDLGDKLASQINGPAWLNQTIQSARGGRLSTHFIWTTDGISGMHGCLLRIERPGDSKSYLVDARFSKRADAKSAVCLQAMSQGVGNYIRAIGKAVEDMVTPMMRAWANEQVLPILGAECNRLKPRCPPTYEFEKDRDAFGCTLILELSPNPAPEEVRRYTTPIGYRTKADAKIGVACLAVREGAIEFLRFRGQPPPPDYVPMRTVDDFIAGGSLRTNNKRKDVGGVDSDDRKKQKIKDEPDVPAAASQVKDHSNGNANASGSGGSGPSASQIRTKGQPRLASRSVGSGALPARPLSGNVPVGFGGGRPPSHAPRPGRGGAHAGPAGNFASPPPMSGPAPFQTAAYHAPGFPPSVHPYYAGPPAPAPGYPVPFQPMYSASPPPIPHQPPYAPYAAPQHPYPYHPGTAPNFYPPQTQTQFPSPLPAPPPNANPPHTLNRKRSQATPSRPNPDGHADRSKRRKASPDRGSDARPAPNNNQSKGQASANSEGSPKLKVTVHEPPKSHVQQLLEHCDQKSIPRPHFHDELVADPKGDKAHKVWVIMGKERLELPVTFPDVQKGRERVAKQVLARLRSGENKQGP
ncbi:hypothetical protein PLICRDRAFT_179128 [Plicaturopsis crispa FD-325 SS-3]|uniref:Unplaced genomic scaffold PLICRscaffold_16, whole genome shotgun sequence n=1 Tax=Plicaturopsis crispa FD-325 SS-3 TaxID=944288 RepID=A0A0C9T981_PLICR|nr:hypothetical protein PLICRDRAFT_179128 [Plicaturopsis crispa FD-325 SS-3]